MSPSKKIAEYVGKSLGSTDEQIAVMAYGLTAILQMLLILVTTLVFGIIFDFWAQVLIIYLSVGFLRRLIGGAHSEGYYSCLCTSILFIIGFSLLSKFVIPVYLGKYVTVAILAAVYIFAFAETYRLAPVASPHKPIRTEKKRKRLRKNSFIVLSAFMILTAIFTVLDFLYGGFAQYNLALALSVLWQTTMLTRAGHIFIGAIDRLFRVKH